MPIKTALINNEKHRANYKKILEDMKKTIEKYKRIDKDNNYFITSSIDFETFLWIKWGAPEFLQKNMTNKEQNQSVLNELISRNTQGIVTMRIDFQDAKGHTTLWDKDHFLDDSNYLLEQIKKANGEIAFNPVVKELHFWELK